jgi:hypothetical protein
LLSNSFSCKTLISTIQEDVFMQSMTPTATVSPSLPGTHRRQTLAQILHAPSFESIDWRRLLQDGVMVKLHIRHCGFTTRLELADLGVRVQDATVQEKVARWLILGSKRLLPEAYMQALTHLESRARYVLKERSFRTELGAFVPSTTYTAWREATETLRTQYFALRDELIAHHREMVRQVLAEYEVIATDTYQRLAITYPDLVTESQAHFTATYCDRIALAIPSPERIQETFDFRYELANGLSQLGTAPTEPVEQETTVLQAEGVQRLDQLRTQTEQRAFDRAAMQRDMQRQAQERVSTMLDEYLSSIVGSLYHLTYEVMCDALSALQQRNGERLSPRFATQLRHLLESVRSLNFYGNDELERCMEQVQQITELSPRDRQANVADIRRVLQSIGTVSRARLLDLEEEPRSARDLGIPEVPTQRIVRQARAELGMEHDEEALVLWAQAQPLATRAARAETAPSPLDTPWNLEEAETPRSARAL